MSLISLELYMVGLNSFAIYMVGLISSESCMEYLVFCSGLNNRPDIL